MIQILFSILLISSMSSIPSIYPVEGWIASDYGHRISPLTNKSEFHSGLDIAAAIGDPIHATADGVVLVAGNDSGLGKYIIIAHGHGIVTRYAHNTKNLVIAGQKVKQGDLIGTVGRSGKVTGAHCHYEVLVNGKFVNPKKFIISTQ
jgi:murein DD-endopeptidase MepM/ murein hydrolase activator NlpD